MENVENVEAAEQSVDPKKKKRDKVRSAWISFAGRIVAQLVGAIATVALGVMVLHRYTSGDAKPGHPNAAAALGALPPAQSPVQIIVLTPGMLGLGDAGARFVAPDRPCSLRLDVPPTSAAHLIR
jgi:hypothetical protein